MKHELHNIEVKINKLDERLDNIDIHLAKYNEQLEVHIKRTELLEDDIKPIKQHVHEVGGMFKVLGIIAALVGIYSVLKPHL